MGRERVLLGPNVHRVHVVGISGAAMSGIAAAMLDQGFQVSGSDLEISTYANRLRLRGAAVHEGHDAAHVAGADLVIASAAIPPDNVELCEAERSGIGHADRSAIVGELFNDKSGIAVAGTHGKTTTSAMTATILREAGYDPSFLIGAASPSIGQTNGRYSKSRWMVVEADEFDEAFLSYRPDVAVITHLEPDHLDYFGTEARMVGAFEQFIEQLDSTATLVLRTDIPLLAPLAECHIGVVVRFGPGEAWDVAGYGTLDTGVTLDLVTPEGPVVSHLAVRGRHNAWNALAALAASASAGVSVTEGAKAIGTYTGADRRMQLRTDACDITVLEDYAHHPTAIAATIAAAREISHRRLWAIFQPLLRSRTRDLFEAFAPVFHDADLVILTEVFSPPGREGLVDISLSALAESIDHPLVRYGETFEDIADLIEAEAVSGDLLLVMGPESITPLADRLADWAQRRSAAA